MARERTSYVAGTSLLTSSHQEDSLIDDVFDAFNDTDELLAACGDDSNGMPFHFTHQKEALYE